MMKKYWMYGKHSVKAALMNPNRKIYKLLVTNEVEAEFKDFKDKIIVPKQEIEKHVGKYSSHQGAAALVEPLHQPALEDILKQNEDKKKATIVVLDQVTDPHNIGAVLRSAAAFEASAVIVQDKNSPGETGALAKASVGTIEKIPLIQVTNINDVLKKTQKYNYWSYAFSGYAENNLTDTDIADKSVLIFGSEGKGVRDLILKTADFKVKINMSSKTESLNISNAVAVSLFFVYNN